jgi:hypothetical protein
MRRVGRESVYLGISFFIISGREENHEYLETNLGHRIMIESGDTTWKF